jgi:hypothetical protein
LVTAVWARGVPSGAIDLEIGAERVPFRYEGRGTLARFAGGELRYAPTGDAAGWYLLRLLRKSEEPLTLTFRPRQELASPYRVFLPQLRDKPPLPLDWTGFPYVPIARILESRGEPWRPDLVY